MFRISEASGIPVYLQLKEQVLHLIALGRLRPGDQLPTVREVAVDLSINPNTVNRAYADLERDGYLTSKRGRGTFVSEPVAGKGAHAQQDKLRDISRRALAECDLFGFTADELLRAIKRLSHAP
ncbi:MAG: GntR family transcriptional regulator [Candidatus Eremiobacter antarcticus]|nr:GntR family transcriptional regulator [Candidatus Eremiobacteraeota bacterium]MBC5807809.1 GntR family transcriptional regulator [Candidatus Eremiobacteraeota bacterium]PZR60781.1 MAG: GntR family transcriptional regulator [Candidatus Eremiobacter sp. RRmetagenome_bin22]